MYWKGFLLSVGALIGLGAVGTVASGAASLDTNLIVNPDAEQGAAARGLSSSPDVPGWKRSGHFTVIAYGAGPNFPTDETIVAPAMHGKDLFVGGPNSPRSEASQTIDVSAVEGDVDGGKLVYILSGYLGGGPGSVSTKLTADFRDVHGKTLATAVLGPITEKQRQGEVCLPNCDTQGIVPAGTRSVVVRLSMVGKRGVYNDSSADDLYLMFTKQASGTRRL